jgi:hypothetical protein
LEKFRQELKQLAMLDDLYKAELRAVAPPSWKEFFEEVDLIDCLFTHGRYIGKHSLGEYGFTSGRKVRSMVDGLAKAWADIVTIKADVRNSQVELRFHVIFG